MEPKKYLYSSPETWFTSILFLGITSFLIYKAIITQYNDSIWMLFAGLGLIAVGATVYIVKTYFIPMLSGSFALEMNKNELNYNITGKIIYWRDIKDITYNDMRYNGRAIYFWMNDGSRIRITTKYVACDDVVTYDSIRTFFLNWK